MIPYTKFRTEMSSGVSRTKGYREFKYRSSWNVEFLIVGRQ